MRNLKAKVGTRQIGLDAVGCASRDLGFRQEDIDDARVLESETLVWRGKRRSKSLRNKKGTAARRHRPRGPYADPREERRSAIYVVGLCANGHYRAVSRVTNFCIFS